MFVAKGNRPCSESRRDDMLTGHAMRSRPSGTQKGKFIFQTASK